MIPHRDKLGDPDLQIAGLNVWVHGRQFPDADCEYDGNWLRVTVICEAPGSRVWTQGALLLASDVERFGQECDDLHRGTSRTAALHPMEPELKATLEVADNLGHIDARVEITPDHSSQAHQVTFAIDQSDLLAIVRQCGSIVAEYPVRGR